MIISVLILVSCDKNKVFEKNLEIDKGLWNSENIAEFDIDINETKIPYNILINIRNAHLYPTSNIWLFVTTVSPKGKSQRDTVEFILANEKGEWLGDGMGDIWDNSLPFKEKIGFPKKGKYKIRIQHGMRVNPLPFILEIGVRVEKADLGNKPI